MPMTTIPTRDLRGVPYDEDFLHGARSAAFTCLKVRPGETVVIITDEQTLPIAAALDEQLRAAEGRVQAFVLEDLATRPLTSFPEPIAAAMESADVTVFAASALPGELAAR